LDDITSIIQVMNLRSIDLNLLVVFDALMRDRHVTRAALHVGLSQPAFSNALTRLRERLQDELFIRSPDGMRPTPRAFELAGPIRAALSEIEQALDGSTFDPATAERSFSIVALDYVAIVLIPPLIERLRTEAPGVTLRVFGASGRSAEMLDAQEVDLALIGWSNPPERFASMPIIDDDWVCMMRAGHPLAKKPLTLDSYAAARHLLVSPSGDTRGWVDNALAEQGRTREVGLVMTGFGPANLSLEVSDMILTCPARVAQAMCRGGMVTVPCPVSAPPAMRSLDMIWHERLGRHPAHVWLRSLIVEVADAKGD
jgi:DNA-binding transcriptional LysR family regulator